MSEHKSTTEASHKHKAEPDKQHDSREQTFKAGDKVTWDSSQGTVHGTVEKKLTEPTNIKSHHVAASKDNPEYLVKSDRTGAEAAHKPGELKQDK